MNTIENAALDATDLRARNFFATHNILSNTGFEAFATVSLSGAVISGTVQFDGAQLNSINGYALEAQRLSAAHFYACSINPRQRFKARGGISLYSATISGTVGLSGAQLIGQQGGTALEASSLKAGSVFARRETGSPIPFIAIGEVSFPAVEIANDLDLVGAILISHNFEDCLRIQRAHVGSLLFGSTFNNYGFIFNGDIFLTSCIVRNRFTAHFDPKSSGKFDLSSASVGTIGCFDPEWWGRRPTAPACCSNSMA